MVDNELTNSNDKKSYTTIVVFAFILIAIVGGFLFINSQKQNNEGSIIESTATATNTPLVTQAVLEAGSFYYKPNTITVKKGDTVKVVINSVDMMHDFVIDELNVRIPIVKAGNSAEATFVANTPGKYEFYCSVGSHRQQGMVGTLIVE